jgi:hypothetical protein
VSPVKYEMGLYIPEDDILHSHCRENLKSYIDADLISTLVYKFLYELYIKTFKITYEKRMGHAVA